MATERVTVREPETCPSCGGDGVLPCYVLDGILLNPRQADMVSLIAPSMGRRMQVHRDPCPACTCVICSSPTDVIGGECGHCHDQADAHFEQVSDR